MLVSPSLLSACLQHGAWGCGPPPGEEDESSICCLWGGQHASLKNGEPQHEAITAEATVEKGVDEGTREPPEPTLFCIQLKLNALLWPVTSFENCLPTVYTLETSIGKINNLKMSVAHERFSSARPETVSPIPGPFSSKEKFIFPSQALNQSHDLWGGISAPNKLINTFFFPSTSGKVRNQMFWGNLLKFTTQSSSSCCDF